jgi:hypothetical protein
MIAQKTTSRGPQATGHRPMHGRELAFRSGPGICRMLRLVNAVLPTARRAHRVLKLGYGITAVRGSTLEGKRRWTESVQR